ncbi:MAG: FAD-dependent oxidoreductase [Microthrixaceae bacterium]
MGTKRVVVIGGDAAGMSSASQARRMQGPEALEIVAFERGPRTSYAACGLPYFVEGIINPADRLVARTPEQFAERDIAVHTGHSVNAIDTRARTIEVEDLASGESRTEGWDELVIATGAVGIKPPLAGIDAHGIKQLRTVEDGIEVDQLIREGARTAAVVGAGYIGIEVAEALLARGLDVTVIQLDETPMAEALDADMGSMVADAMRGAGAEVILGAGADEFETQNGRLSAVVADGRSIPADLAVLGIGVKANSQLASDAGIEVGGAGGVIVDERMRTRTEGVWAAGDCVESHHRITGESVVMALGTHANKQGRVLGTNIGGGDLTFPGVIGTAVTKFRDLEIGRTGITETAARRLGWDIQVTVVDSKTRAGYYPGAEPITVKVIADRSDGRILGAQVVGGPGAGKRIDSLALAVWTEMAVHDLAMADLSYAPPVSPVWDPVVFAAGVAANDLNS